MKVGDIVAPNTKSSNGWRYDETTYEVMHTSKSGNYCILKSKRGYVFRVSNTNSMLLIDSDGLSHSPRRDELLVRTATLRVLNLSSRICNGTDTQQPAVSQDAVSSINPHVLMCLLEF